MSSLKEIKARINTSVNTKQITRAMKMVSAAKLKKYQDLTVNSRPYAKSLLKIIYEISQDHDINHPLLSTKDDKKSVLLVVISGDRGLCGAFNSYINKKAMAIYKQFSKEYEKVEIFSVGRKNQEFFKKQKIDITECLANLSNEVSYERALQSSKDMITDEQKYSRVVFIYNSFKSILSQEVVAETIFPVNAEILNIEDNIDMSHNFIFEPKPEDVLDELLSRHFAIQVYRCLLESVAAEHAARMNSMESATKNATEMIDALKLTYNKLRQSAITTELSEICGGAEALKG